MDKTIITVDELNKKYYYKEDLTQICKKLGLKSTGRKLELKEKIIHFLNTGEELNIKQSKSSNRRQELPKELNEIIPDNFTSSQFYRVFFTSIIGDHFHYTAHNMRYLKNNPGICYKEYIDEWNREYERKKDKNYKQEILKSCQYNQYIRDFFDNNKTLTLKDAIKCWKYKRDSNLEKVYCKDDLSVLN